MAVRILRESSETPNITNRDDAVMLKHSYGGYSGFVKDYGKELSNEGSTKTQLKINSGMVVLQGWEVEVEGSGWVYNVPNTVGTYFCTAYLMLNLAVDEATINVISDTVKFPEVSPGENLTRNPYGTANIALYNFTVSNGKIIDTVKVVEKIKKTSEIYAEIKSGKTIVKSAEYAIKDENGYHIADNYVMKSNMLSSLYQTTTLLTPGFYYGVFQKTADTQYVAGMFYWEKGINLVLPLYGFPRITDDPGPYVYVNSEGSIYVHHRGVVPEEAVFKVAKFNAVFGGS